LRLVDGAIQGKVRLHAGIGGTQLQSERMPALLRAEVSQVFAALDTIDATLLLSGRLDQPQLEIQSDVGQRIAAGMQSAFARQAEQWKQSLTTKVNEIAQSETNQLSQKLNTRYQGLLSQHGDMLSQLKGVQTLLASVQGGQSNPGDLFRQVSGTGLIPSNKSRKTKQVQDQLDQAGNLLQGLGGSIFR